MTDSGVLPQPDPRRWKALAVLGLIQFMLVLDITVVNVALPSIQHDLGFSRSGLAWVVNGYVLMAGGFLLLGGRLADFFGRRRLFLLGVVVFAAASATSGAATSQAMLVTSRFFQGLGEAMAAPASLGLVAVLFPDPRERIKALGIWGGIAGIGGTTGTVISGILTDLVSWRWIFYINLPIAAVALICVPRLVSESRMVRSSQRIDIVGALCFTGGLVAIVDGLLQAASHAWGSVSVLLPLAGGVALVVVTGLAESRLRDPLIPMRFFANRTRVATNVVTLFFASAFFSYFFLLTLYEQQVLGFSPLEGGLLYVPFGLSIGAGIGIGTGVMPRLGVKGVMTIGFVLAAAGLLMTGDIHVGASYAAAVLPGMIVLGLGSGLIFPAAQNAALHHVTGQDSSLASGVQSAMQQVGGAIGLAVLVTLALRHAATQTHHGVRAAVASTHGYVLSFRVGSACLVVGGLLVVGLLERVDPEPHPAGAEMPVELEGPEPGYEPAPAVGR